MSNDILDKNLYSSLYTNLNSISSPTILIARKNLNPQIIELMLDLFKNKHKEFLAEDRIFYFINFTIL